MDDHVSRILKMLEEGKISAADAQALLAAVKPEEKAQTSSSTSSRSADRDARTEGTSSQQESTKAKSFEFQWSQRRGLPFDLSGLGKQISDAVKRIDPERLVREARTGLSRGGKRFQGRFKGFAWFVDSDEGRPENVMGSPTARTSDSLDFDLTTGATIQVENNWGAIAVFGGAEKVKLEYDKEVWAPTDTEAAARLGDLKIEAGAHAPDGGVSRLEIRVLVPEDWRDGTADLRLHVPDAVVLKLSTNFGDIRVEKTSGGVEAHSISGTISLEELKSEVRAETITGEANARKITGPLHIASKSGNLSARGLEQGGSIIGVSGDVKIHDVEGGRLEAKSVSGDVYVEDAGHDSPVDIKIESISGDLHLSQARGNISLKTVSGDVLTEELDALTLQSETVSGDVKVGLKTAFSGTLSTNTVSGDVFVRAPQDSNFRFTLATQSGELHCSHDVKDQNRTPTLCSGTLGTGAGNVTVQTRSGDVFLEKPE